MWFFAPTISQALSSSTKRAWKSSPSPEASKRRELLDFSRSEEQRQEKEKPIHERHNKQPEALCSPSLGQLWLPTPAPREHNFPATALAEKHHPRCPKAHHEASSHEPTWRKQ